MERYGITVNAISPDAVTDLFPMRRGTPAAIGKEPANLGPMLVYLSTDEAKDVTGQIIFAGGGEIILYAPPMQTPGAHQFYHKDGKWTLDELSEIVPTMITE